MAFSPSKSRVSSSLTPKKPNSMRIKAAIRHKSCPICLGPIEESKAAVIRICLHTYCIDCIRKWSELKRNCPLCNAKFNSWFCNIRVSTGKYDEERLPSPKEMKNVGFVHARRERGRLAPQRLLSRSRDQVCTFIQHSRPLPWRRSFGPSRFSPSPEGLSHHAQVIAERVLQWRASIYKQRLQAVPLPFRDGPHLNVLGNNDVKQSILRRIEPWIRRELQAVLADSDPSVIVHLASSLWILCLEEKLKLPPKSFCGHDKYFRQLRPFLHDQADMFWHELRCFAACSFTMETYDMLVEYKPIG
ncbi:RING/U-box superfamily protein [Tasmannia lanceolata]|uniref:RING/U-box superfamily protein n=1 Tax=Tasmannia lanceolata TaxID=3420 RepID=UPI0040633E45